MKDFRKKLKKNSDILVIIFFISFIIMLLISILLGTILTDKNRYINGLTSDKNICMQKYEELINDYAKLEEDLRK